MTLRDLFTCTKLTENYTITCNGETVQETTSDLKRFVEHPNIDEDPVEKNIDVKIIMIYYRNDVLHIEVESWEA